MSAPKKPQQEGELPKLKQLWPTLHENVQGYWREQFLSQRSQADIRKEISAKLKINLQWDTQLTRFRDWLNTQDLRDLQAERAQENERRLKAEHPDWSLDRIREEVLRQSYFETLASGDFKLGLKTVKADQNERILDLDRAKFEFDAAKACLEKLPELKAISEKPKLSEEEKTKAIQQILFNR